jgi:hypothetical protein
MNYELLIMRTCVGLVLSFINNSYLLLDKRCSDVVSLYCSFRERQLQIVTHQKLTCSYSYYQLT